MFLPSFFSVEMVHNAHAIATHIDTGRKRETRGFLFLRGAGWGRPPMGSTTTTYHQQHQQ